MVGLIQKTGYRERGVVYLLSVSLISFGIYLLLNTVLSVLSRVFAGVDFQSLKFYLMPTVFLSVYYLLARVFLHGLSSQERKKSANIALVSMIVLFVAANLTQNNILTLFSGWYGGYNWFFLLVFSFLGAQRIAVAILGLCAGFLIPYLFLRKL